MLAQRAADEFERAAKAGMPAQAAVLSISAIVTLSLIDGWKYLHSGRTYFVSQLTSEVIDGWIHAASDIGSKEGGVVNLDDNGQLIVRETTAAERTTRLEELRAVKD